MGVINILKHELDNKLPHWLTQSDAQTKLHDAIYNKHRKRYLDEQKAKREAENPKPEPGSHLFSERAVPPDWEEEKHPRGQPENQGQFTHSTSPGSSAPGAAGAVPPAQTVPGAPGAVPGQQAVPPKKKVALNDFTEDKIELDAKIERSKEKADKFVEVWDQYVGVDPGEFKNEFLGGLNATMKVEHTYNEDNGEVHDNVMTVHGDLLDAADNVIGNYRREIDFQNNEATASRFELKKGATGGGVGKTMLAANVAYYQKLGLDRVNTHANIDVGGYAWAKYGYVPSDSSWRDLSESVLEKLGGASYKPDTWGEMDGYQQDDVYRQWQRDTFSDFLSSETDHWHESGGALDDAKTETAEEFNTQSQWAFDALQEARRSAGSEAFGDLTNDQILYEMRVEYSGDGEGGNDPDIFIEQVEGLGDDAREAIEAEMTAAFNRKAEERAPMMDMPESRHEGISNYQLEYWDSMDAEQKYEWAERNDALPTSHGDDSAESEELRTLANDSDPKALWVIADSLNGKDLLLGTDWSGSLELHDPDSMTRFNAYVGKPRAQ